MISTYLLTHLHHVLQRAEYGASQEGRSTQAANYAQLRKCSVWTPAAWRTPRPWGSTTTASNRPPDKTFDSE